jgi:hypothetical protein
MLTAECHMQALYAIAIMLNVVMLTVVLTTKQPPDQMFNHPKMELFLKSF